MAGGAGGTAADRTEGIVAMSDQLVAADRRVTGIAPAQGDLTVTRRGTQVARRQRHRQHRCRAQRR